MKIIPKLILMLVKFQEKGIITLYGQKPESIYCFRDEQNRVQGLLFINENEREKLAQEYPDLIIPTKLN